MLRIVPTTSYRWVAEDLKDLAEDLHRIATDTTENKALVESLTCYSNFTKILDSLILATRLAGAWPFALPTDAIIDYLSITH